MCCIIIIMKDIENKQMNQIITDIRDGIKTMAWYDWIMTVVMIAIASIAVYNGFTNPDSYNPGWLTIINFISAICGCFCVFLTARASIGNCFFAVINTIVYIVFLTYHWNDGFTATLILELVFYFPMNIAIWVYWAKHRDNIESFRTKAKKLTIMQDMLVGIVVVAVALLSYKLLNNYHLGCSTIFDSFIFAIGIIAVSLQLLRYREQYALWIITDVFAVAQFIHKFDAVYLTKKSIYLIVAIIGIYNWWKLNKERNIENE